MKKIMLIFLFVGSAGFASEECERMLSGLIRREALTNHELEDLVDEAYRVSVERHRYGGRAYSPIEDLGYEARRELERRYDRLGQ